MMLSEGQMNDQKGANMLAPLPGGRGAAHLPQAAVPLRPTVRLHNPDAPAATVVPATRRLAMAVEDDLLARLQTIGR